MNYRQLVLIAFLGNGFTLLGIQVISRFTNSSQSNSPLLMMYIAASILTLALVLNANKKIEAKNILVGAMGGLGSAFGLTANITAVRYIPGHIVFPIVNGGIILIVVLIGSTVFKEKVGKFGIIGISCGVAAIVMLSLK